MRNHIRTLVWPEFARAVLQRTRGDAEGDLPDPSFGLAQLVSAPKGLSERLRESIARDLRVAGVGDEGTPQPGPLSSIEPFQSAHFPLAHERIVLHLRKGRVSTPNV